jgi:hypothetical protein
MMGGKDDVNTRYQARDFPQEKPLFALLRLISGGPRQRLRFTVNHSTLRPKGRGLLEVHPEPLSSTPPSKLGLPVAEWVKFPAAACRQEGGASSRLARESPSVQILS